MIRLIWCGRWGDGRKGQGRQYLCCSRLSKSLISQATVGHGESMDNRNRIVDFIVCFPGRDDDEISKALQITPRQTVNQICRALAKAGLLERRSNATGKLANYPLGTIPVQSPLSKVAKPTRSPDATADWFWEGNVTTTVASFLREQGWAIISQADTSKKKGAWIFTLPASGEN